jgi:demethylmenaquinone methyltransferase/2-methoxy-6-polyprenyl-1,4-benzoquinol methylase
MSGGMDQTSTSSSRAASGPDGPDASKIRHMFSGIAGRYDLANTILSGGIHHLWRQSLVDWSGARAGQQILDCATGTGDLAIAFKSVVGHEGQVTGTDFCAEMLGPAPAKAAARGYAIQFSQADVTELPFADASFDIASISFGIRNVDQPVKGLSELARVVRPGGVVMVLEFGQPETPLIADAYRLYSEKILPRLGGWITGAPEAYQYLQTSSSQFPCGNAFLDLMTSTGRFAQVEARRLSFGVAWMYKGVVSPS